MPDDRGLAASQLAPYFSPGETIWLIEECKRHPQGRGNFSGQGQKFANEGLNSGLSLGLHKAKAGEDTRGPRDARKNCHTHPQPRPVN